MWGGERGVSCRNYIKAAVGGVGLETWKEGLGIKAGDSSADKSK